MIRARNNGFYDEEEDDGCESFVAVDIEEDDESQRWLLVFRLRTTPTPFFQWFDGSFNRLVENCFDLLQDPKTSAMAREGCEDHGRYTFFRSGEVLYVQIAHSSEVPPCGHT